MRRFLAVPVLVFGLALTQDVGIPPDLAEWFASQASLAAVVAALVALIRKHLWRGLDGAAVVGVSVALGIVLAHLGHRLGYLGTNDWFVFGLAAGLLASGGVDALRGIMKGGGGASSGAGGAPPDADRSRLR
jgi:hypothetical protein